MKLNWKDFLWGATVAIIAGLFIIPATSTVIIGFTSRYVYLGGFIKFAILASLGELLGIRILEGKWRLSVGFVPKALVWGLIGMSITLMFNLFPGGVAYCQEISLLPGQNSPIFTALIISILINLGFAPVFMSFHKISDAYINRRYAGESTDINSVVNSIDWGKFVTFVLGKTVPIFWIPAQFVNFSLPAEMRIVVAAFLSILLGAILGFAAKKQ